VPEMPRPTPLLAELAAGITTPPFAVVTARAARHRRRQRAAVGGTAATALAVVALLAGTAAAPGRRTSPAPGQLAETGGHATAPPLARGLIWDALTATSDGRTLVALGADCGAGQLFCRAVERVSRDAGQTWSPAPAPAGHPSNRAAGQTSLAVVGTLAVAHDGDFGPTQVGTPGGRWRSVDRDRPATASPDLGGFDERNRVSGGVLSDRAYAPIDSRTKRVTCGPGVVVLSAGGATPIARQPRPPFQTQVTRSAPDGTLWQLSALFPPGCGYPFPGQPQVHGKTAFTSADGGRQWRRLPDPPDAMITETLTPVSATTAFVTRRRWSADPGLLVTRDGGRTWQDLHPAGLAGAGFRTSLAAFDAAHLAAVTDGTALLVSVDGGGSFRRTLAARPGDAVVRVGAITQSYGLALTRLGRAYTTGDAGVTWTELAPLH
jgi:photosystem II stability/assembly factor-like uncharacterized protein